MSRTTDVDTYFVDGCGRCPLFATPECKVRTWQKELEQLRRIVQDCGLTEEAKWGVPVYTWQQNNVVVIGAFKDNCVLSFFKGSLLQDPEGILTLPGENTQSAKVVRFTSVNEIIRLEATLKAYIFEAIEVERAGLKADFKQKDALVFPEELIKKMAENPEFKAAFEALTPGRQRGYNLYFSAPKQSKTREARIEKWMPQIFEGKGMHD